MVMMVRQKIDAMTERESIQKLRVWRNEANIVYRNGADCLDCIWKFIFHSVLYRIIKEGALTRSHKPIFKIEEVMLDKHMSFETIGGNK